jgi:acyl-CoA synthetase (AMP-forming)/AMP-acid ligase II
MAGADLLMPGRYLQAEPLAKFIARERPTTTCAVPTIWADLLRFSEDHDVDFSSLQRITCGGAAVPRALMEAFQDRFGIRMIQAWGMTETSPVAAMSLPPRGVPLGTQEEMDWRSLTGRPLPGVELRIVGDDGRDLGPDQVGEIVVRSRQVMSGYWKLPEATARAIQGEWFFTGDAGYLDDKGYLYIYDRVKDMIVSGGENIYPAEVESALFGHPAVADVAVIGVPDERWGEAVKAVVVKKPGSDVMPGELIGWARERIAGYKLPKSVDFVEALPRNPTGKILKRELRKPYWGDRVRQVN